MVSLFFQVAFSIVPTESNVHSSNIYLLLMVLLLLVIIIIIIKGASRDIAIGGTQVIYKCILLKFG
jgi:hypothetical protein